MRYRYVILILMLLAALPARAQDEAGDLLGRINALRGSLGLPGYTFNGALAAAAQSQAQWMADTGMVSHTRPDGSTPRQRALNAGYGTTEVSENIYGGSNASVNAAWNFWINSRIHYLGLTNVRYKEVGIGIARSAWGAAYVLVFGNPGGPEYVPPVVNTRNGGGSAGGGQPSYVAGLDPHGNIMHEVQPGDTIGDNALIYGYTWDDVPAMLTLNGLTQADIRDLEIGSIFLVPPKDGTYTPTAPAETATATATAFLEVAAAATGTATPDISPTPTLPGIATLDKLPEALALPVAVETTTPSPTAQTVALVATRAAPEIIKGAGVVTPSSRQSPWLAIALVVQVGVLVVAGFEFIRRVRRRS
ncbi:MAG: hypothetical protein HZC41_09225 [Chloroflexi bacterium]|nr:hypothetical protein [Chloroflexota bacterium]